MKGLFNNNLIRSFFSGILLFLSFTHLGTLFSFFAFVPILFLAKEFVNQKLRPIKFIFLILLSFLIWNGLTTWWISLASVGGAVMAIVANSILMCMVFSLPFMLQKKFAVRFNVWHLIPFWISFEYLHFHWDLMWPWLTLGNVFAFVPLLVQWYELTGTAGGSLWILVINSILFKFFNEKMNKKQFIKNLATALLIPIILSISIYIYRTKTISSLENNQHLNVLIVQPNVDPYNDKFYIEPLIQVQSMYQQIKGVLNDSIDVVLLPETFITENIYEGGSKEMLQYPSLKFLKDSILSRYPEITVITGANTFKFYSSDENPPSTARQNSEGLYYDIFNTALCIYRDSVQIFHKSKLVPGVEKMPYPGLFRPLEKLAIDLGGTTGSLGQQDYPSLLYVRNRIPVATVICYESVFSDFVSKFFRLGAQTLLVITNDGWWGNTPGYYQHLIFGRLRAIENRTFIGRCANTGVSAVINPIGEIEQSTLFWTKECLVTKVPLVNTSTVYSKIGDVISPICILILLGILVNYILIKIKK
ncbi:MAG: apolipoprotein N-acyltransferase [Bacteroidia bacterium]|nr:MAG: apolipoprotein N-acyltransferase [Bacteroidia bacterium]